ncbi:MAG: hypothetical protein ACYDHD_05630 [Vulcanimicrobiaceae bacterium]
MKNQLQLQATYPQSVAQYTGYDLSQLNDLAMQIDDVTSQNQNVDQQVSSVFKSVSNTINPVATDTMVAQNLRSSIEGVLSALNYTTTADSRDASTVQIIQNAAAQSTSPQQLQNMTVQLLAVMSDQLTRASAINRTKISAELTAKLNAMAAKTAKERQEKKAIRSTMQMLDPTLAAPTPGPN